MGESMSEKQWTSADRINHLNDIKAKLEAVYHSGKLAQDRDVYDDMIGALNGRIADIEIDMMIELQKRV